MEMKDECLPAFYTAQSKVVCHSRLSLFTFGGDCTPKQYCHAPIYSLAKH